jgi:hypothetical protein
MVSCLDNPTNILPRSHCNQCRHQSSSSYGLTAIFPAFTISSPSPGALSVYTRHTLSNRKLDCYFCAKCGSRLMHKTEGEAELSVKAGCLEGLDLRGERGRKAVHIWTKEAVVDIPEGVERYEEEPPGGSLQGQEGGES